MLDLAQTLFDAEIAGQPEAVAAFAEVAARAAQGMQREDRALAVLLLAGPIGAGKGTAANALARLLLGTERRAIRLNLALFQQPAACGQALLAACAAMNGHAPGAAPLRVLILQGVEHATPPLLEMLVDMFHHGELAVAPGVALDLRRTVVLLETSAGVLPADEAPPPLGFHGADPDARAGADRRNREAVQAKLRAAFPARLLGAVDEIVVFRRVWPEDLPLMLDRMLARVQRALAPVPAWLHVEEAARALLLDEGGRALQFGAKELRQAVERRLELPLHALLRQGALRPGGTIYARRSLDGITLFVPLA